jgi:hypothetical protein
MLQASYPCFCHASLMLRPEGTLDYEMQLLTQMLRSEGFMFLLILIRLIWSYIYLIIHTHTHTHTHTHIYKDYVIRI